MFSHHHRSRGKPSPSQPANQFALAAAAAAAVPSRTQTPTLSAAAAAAALHASPRQITSPAAVVTRRMERRGSISSITSAPPGHPVARRGSDASMTERIGWLRSDEASAPSSGRPGSRGGRPSSRDSPAASSPPVKQTTGKRAVSHDRVPSNTSEPSRRAPKQAAKRPAPRTHEEDHRQSADEPRKVSRPRKAPTKPRASSDPPVPSLPPAVRAAVAVAAPARKQQQKPKPKPKPEPVYSSSGNEDDSSSLPSDSEPEPQHPPTVHLKKSLRGPPADAANKKKKNVPTHSDAQGSMLARGTMRTTVRDDMVTVVEAAKERQRQNGTRPARSNSASQASHAPHKPQETDVGHSDAVMALALQLMREQQAQTAGKPVLLPSKRAKKRMRRVEEPDAAADEDDGAFIPDEAGDDSDIYRRNSYAGSVHSVASYQSDLESIPEEYSDDDGKKKKKKKKKGKGKRQQGRESVIVPGKDGVPALPNNPLLDQERERLARIRSPEPAQSKTVERKRTLEKLTGESPVPQKTAVNPPLPLPVEPSVINTPPYDPVKDVKGSSPSSSPTLTEEPVQPIIHMIPPTPPCTADQEKAPPRLFGTQDSSDDSSKPTKPLAATVAALRAAKSRSSPPPRDTHSPRPLKRHSPPPRSVSPAKSALKHPHHEGSDKSSILSAEDGSIGGAAGGRRKAARVSFSEDPSVVEMDDDAYHYRPIHSALDKLAVVQKQPSRGIGAVSFSSISRTRVERTPSPSPDASRDVAREAPRTEASSDSRLGGLIGSEFLGKLKKVATGRSKEPVVKDPLAPEVSSMSPAPSLSDEELESEREEEHPGEVRNQGVIGAILPGFLTVASPEPVEPVAQVVEPVIQPVVEPVVEPVVGPVVEPVEEDVPESPRIAQIAAGHTPPALDIKPIFPPVAEAATDTPAETIAQGRLSLGSLRDDSETDDHFSDAYEHLDHVVLSTTGSGALIGVTTAHTSPPVAQAQPAAEAVVLPNIAEVVTEQSEEVEAAGMQAAGPLPEEVIGEGDERPAQTQTQNILSPKPIKLVSAGLIAAGLTPAHTADQSVAVVGAQNGVSKPDVAITGTTAKKASAKPKTGLSEPKHAPKAKHAPNKVVPVPSPATANGGKLKKLRQATSPAPQRLSVDSDASESSFKREKPRRRAQEGGGFARMSMRDGNGVVPASASARRGSGDRPSRMIGTGGPRRRDWSPDTSDDDRSTVLTKSGKKGGGFLGKATLRGGSNNRPHSSLGLPPSTTGSGFRSRFEDSSDDEDAEPTRMLETMRTHSAVYRPLTPDSSDGEEEEVRRPATAGAAGSGASESFGKRTPVYAPAGASAGMFGYTTSISAGVAPKKKWWSFGSKRKQKVIGVSSATYVPGPTEEPDLVVVGESLPGPGPSPSPVPPVLQPPRGSQMKKFRRLSGGSVTSMGSQRTWTPSLGTSTLAGGSIGSGAGVAGAGVGVSGARSRLSGLREVDEDGSLERLNRERERPSTAVSSKAQVVEPNGGIYSGGKLQKKKKFPKLRRMFGIED